MKLLRANLLFLLFSILASCSANPGIDTLSLFPGSSSATSYESYDPIQIKEVIGWSSIYWQAQLLQDEEMHKRVTRHKMKTIYKWSALKTPDYIIYEEGKIGPIKYYIEECIKSWNAYEESFDKNDLFKARDIANKMKENYPVIGQLFLNEEWRYIIPDNITTLPKYKIMRYDFTADVTYRSRNGQQRRKPLTTNLYRFITDEYDSGWLVLYIRGVHASDW
ncbi:MAG: hypothetical protein ISR96_11390 [Nitrospira sp.]|nr:hypothetical protein [Nitrospira sp.]